MSMRAARLILIAVIAGSGVLPAIRAASKAKTKAPPLTAEQRAVQAQLKSMSLRDKAAQLVVVTANGDVYSAQSQDYQKYRRWIADLHVGGIIISSRRHV